MFSNGLRCEPFKEIGDMGRVLVDQNWIVALLVLLPLELQRDGRLVVAQATRVGAVAILKSNIQRLKTFCSSFFYGLN